MENIIISVIMSVYNDEKYLNNSIESILNQSFINYEFIIINDGSTDKSLEIIQKYQNIDSRIILLNNGKNLGLPESLNKGIQLAKGKYIARMDADDISLPLRLEYQYKFLEDNKNIGIVGTYVKTFGSDNSIWRYPITSSWIKTGLVFGSCLCHPSVMIRKEILLENPYDCNFLNNQDFDLWTRLSKKNYKFYNIPKVLLHFRITGNNFHKRNNTYVDDKRKKILISNLIELNITIDNTPLNIFNNISKGQYYLYEKDIIILLTLFNKIIESNNKKNIYNKYYLKSAIGIIWFNILKNNFNLKFLFSKFTFYFLGGILLKIRGYIGI